MCSHVICFTLCNLCNICYLSNLNNMCNICSAHCTFVPPLVSTGIRKVYYRPRVLTAQVFTQYKHRRYSLQAVSGMYGDLCRVLTHCKHRKCRRPVCRSRWQCSQVPPCALMQIILQTNKCWSRRQCIRVNTHKCCCKLFCQATKHFFMGLWYNCPSQLVSLSYLGYCGNVEILSCVPQKK